jgi:hypothetical protein
VLLDSRLHNLLLPLPLMCNPHVHSKTDHTRAPVAAAVCLRFLQMPVDVLGVVTQCGQLGTIKRKADNSELPRRDVTIADSRCAYNPEVLAAVLPGA